ncbi:threonine/homoserine/homoserine lactone efflux protein [Kitasatospora sp. SolWspMP-SS2h]|uniref:LysE family translocator n=1 Tax=Kitasatospora sp. SolWspMP-SS2h TaxID=1305729 RepID=UPI000DBA7979|nr:LysE family transporter [Kitasatospora sp. SolWspMP-SS2h]RAJ38344.1 threonine/homoserine/homoserine lactone efflux protein [Kitasatospora sp. SolWspMP-SS2h]
MTSSAFAVAASPAFLASCAAVVCSPGPDSLLVLRLVSRARHRRPVLAAAGGMLLAGAGYAALAVTGSMAVTALDPRLFLLWRAVGALVLAVTGARALWEAVRPGPPGPGAPEPGPARDRVGRHLLLGFLCTAGNPKVGLFLTVFLPQFLPADAASASALPLLAAVYLSIGALWLLVLTEVGVRVVTARGADGRAAFPPLAGRIGGGVVGAVLLLLAASLLFR